MMESARFGDLWNMFTPMGGRREVWGGVGTNEIHNESCGTELGTGILLGFCTFGGRNGLGFGGFAGELSCSP